MKLNTLTPAETQVIVDRGTEAPGTGEYEHFDQNGVFTCRQCGAYLYRSVDKFDAHCGWPSFDDSIIGAVKELPDPDGMRTEIECQRCGGHLGHVFRGEQLTDKDTRHCVNSISMKFVAENKVAHTAKAYFGGGCFWCTEAAFKMVKGVNQVVSGYAGGTTVNPNYEQVCEGDTGHAEVIEVSYDPSQIAYEALLQVFFLSHDPTSRNQQGNDVGTQYRSIILYQNDLEKELIDKKINELNNTKVFGKPIVTEVKKLTKFYPAEKYHQDYYAKNPDQAYCQVIINPKLKKLKHELKSFLK